MKDSRIIISRGLLSGSNRLMGIARSDHPTLKFMPRSMDCNRCTVCREQDNSIEMVVNGLIPGNIESMGALSTTGVSVNVAIAKNRMLTILWHTLLLPLSGFVSGAALGYIALQTEVATIGSAVAGLIIAVWCTRQIPLQAVTIEIASDINHGEHE